ncbi:hypothetical protein ACEPAH_2896 [Sanghuangporus vaninii]
MDFAWALTVWRFAQPLQSNEPAIKLTTIELFNHVRDVIKRTSRPTWLRPVPYNFGYTSASKVKADEWRILSTVYLPVALVTYCFYSNESDGAHKERLQAVVDNTMDLVQAVTVLFKKSTSERETTAYKQYIRKYVMSLPSIYPNVRSVPNMHMAKHIAEFLPLFGSVYSWWSFPFERLIGVLQSLSINNKLGEMEGTIHNTFVATSRLKQRLSRPNCPLSVQACLAVIDGTLMQRSAFSSESVDSDESNTPAEFPILDTEMLKTRPDERIKRCKWNNVQYSIRSSHEGNSQILFRPMYSTDLVPAYIRDIEEGDIPTFVVHRLQPAADLQFDAFHKYPDFPAVIYSKDCCSVPETIDGRVVQGHFAAFPLGKRNVVVLSLLNYSSD